MGLDRIDGDRGYEPDNVLPACTFCNRWRADGFMCTADELLQLMALWRDRTGHPWRWHAMREGKLVVLRGSQLRELWREIVGPEHSGALREARMTRREMWRNRTKSRSTHMMDGLPLLASTVRSVLAKESASASPGQVTISLEHYVELVAARTLLKSVLNVLDAAGDVEVAWRPKPHSALSDEQTREVASRR